MTFGDVVGIAALAGVALIVVGALLLALFPRWGGFTFQRAEGAPAPKPIDRFAGALVDAFTSFLEIVRKMLTHKAGDYHPGQVLVAIGFLLFLTGGLLWLVAQLAGSS